MTNDVGIPCCPRCLVEMADHDDELCPMLARVVEKSRHRDNFGNARPVTICAAGTKPECRRRAAGASRRVDDAGERQLPPADRRNAPEMMAHKDQQADWVSSGRGGNQNERMLEILWDGFVPEDPSRLSRGRWVADAELIYQHKIGKPHSRAAELRGRTVTHESHPLVKLWRLDVDQSSDASVTGIEGSAYSICFIEIRSGCGANGRSRSGDRRPWRGEQTKMSEYQKGTFAPIMVNKGLTCLTCGITGETVVGWPSPTTCPKCGSKEPKACPFCGCIGAWGVQDDAGKEFWLECAICHAHGPHAALAAMAKHEWDRRNQPVKRIL